MMVYPHGINDDFNAGFVAEVTPIPKDEPPPAISTIMRGKLTFTEPPKPPSAEYRTYSLANGDLTIFLEFWPAPVGYANWRCVYWSATPIDVFPFGRMHNLSEFDARAGGLVIAKSCRPIAGGKFSVEFAGNGALTIDCKDCCE